MDTKQLATLANTKFDHALFRKNLKESVQSQLAVTHNNGLFKASPELISFLTCWDGDIIYLEDEYSNPTRCERLVLLDSLKQSYQYAMNHWHVEFEKSKTIRRASDV